MIDRADRKLIKKEKKRGYRSSSERRRNLSPACFLVMRAASEHSFQRIDIGLTFHRFVSSKVAGQLCIYSLVNT